MKADMLQVITGKPGQCLSGAYDLVFNRPDKTIIQARVKNPQGWPWDIRIVTDTVYDTITEGKYGWNPAGKVPVGCDSAKIHTGNGGLGNPMFPRMVDMDALKKAPLVTVSENSPFQIWLNNQTDLKPHSVNKTRFTLYYPRPQLAGEFSADVAKRIGDSWVWDVDYDWGAKTDAVAPVREKYNFVSTRVLTDLSLFGLVRWRTNNWDAAKKAYVETGRSDSNMLQTPGYWKVPDFTLIDCPLIEPALKGVELL